MTEALVNKQKKPKAMDLLNQPIRAHNDDATEVQAVNQVEDLEIQSEEKPDVQKDSSLEHLSAHVVHKNAKPVVDGKLQGLVQAHDQEGNLLSHHYYEDGLLQGEARKYDSRQRLRDRVTYLNGEPHGPAEFYQNGRAVMHTHYKFGEHHGETTYYDPNSGMVTARVNHQDGKKHGTAITYDAHGKPQRVLHYVENELDGPAFSYHSDGGVLQEGHYVQGRKHGQFTTYYKNGETRKVEFYENGRQTRKPVFFSPDGEEYEPKY